MTTDRESLLLMLADSRVPTVAIHSYMYLLQYSDIDLGLHFSLTSRGVHSKQLKQLLDNLDAEGYFIMDKTFSLSDLGELRFEDLYLTEDMIIRYENCLNILSPLTVDEIDLVTTTDVIVQDKVKKEGISALATQRDKIIKIIEGFKYTTYSEETFSKVFGILQALRF